VITASKTAGIVDDDGELLKKIERTYWPGEEFTAKYAPGRPQMEMSEEEVSCVCACACACVHVYIFHTTLFFVVVSLCVSVCLYDLRVHLQEDEKDNLLLLLDGVGAGKAGVKVEEEDEEDKESAEVVVEEEVVEDEREEVYDEDDDDNLELLLGKRKG
jgi:hypothetical protein